MPKPKPDGTQTPHGFDSVESKRGETLIACHNGHKSGQGRKRLQSGTQELQNASMRRKFQNE
jgi:hypothetical protein